MGTQNIQHQISDGISGSGLSQSVRHYQHAGDHPYHIRGHGLHRLVHLQNAAVDQQQNADAGSQIQQNAGPFVENHERHYQNKYGVHGHFLIVGQGLRFLGLL